MATFKGIGFDTVTARTRTGTSSDDIAFDSLITATDGVSVTGVGLTVGTGGASITGGTTSDVLTVSGDASVGGDLTVAGDIISRGQVDLVVQDNFIDLNAGNDSQSPLSSGFTFQINRASGFNSGTVTTFVAGVAGNSNPTFTNTDAGSSTALVAGDVVFIASASEGSNDGLYLVNGVSGASFPQTVTIKGIGTVAVDPQLPFCQNQFTADTGNTASVYKVSLKVMAVADGVNFAQSSGSQFPKGTIIEAFSNSAVRTDFTDNGDYSELGSASSLQIAYDTGNTIQTAGNTDIALTLASGDLTATGAGSVLLTPTGASSFTSGGALTLTSATACTWSTSAGALVIDGAGGLTFAGNSSEIDMTTTGALDLNSGAFTLNASTASIDSTDSTSLTMTANANSNKVLQIQAINSGSGESALTMLADNIVNINASGTASTVIGNAGSNNVTIDSAGVISLDSADASNFTVAGADLTLATTTSGEVDITSAGLMDLNAGANLDVDVTGSFDVLASTTFSIAGTGASNVTATSGSLTLATATSGDLLLTGATRLTATSGDIMSFTMNANDANLKSLDIISNNTGSGDAQIQIDADNFVKIGYGGVTRLDIGNGLVTVQPKLVIDATNGLQFGSETTLADSLKDEDNMASNDANALATQQSIKAYVDSNGQSGYNRVTILTADGSGIAQRDVVAINASGQATKADANAIGDCRVIGLALNTASSGQPVEIAQVGKLGGYSGLTAGNVLYASTTAGAVSATVPSGAGDVVVQVGYASSATEIVIQPLFIMELG